jgi:hypothetical protein
MTHPMLRLLSSLVLVFALAGCLTTPVADSGGMGSITVQNSNPSAIISAAQTVFAGRGYSQGPIAFPDSASFDKPSGAFGKLMWGGYDQTTTVRATMSVTAIPGTSNYRLHVKPSVVNDANDPGFSDSRPLVGPWAAEFSPLLKEIAAQAGGAGGL